MAFPKKNDADKCIKQNISFEPKDLERLIKFCPDNVFCFICHKDSPPFLLILKYSFVLFITIYKNIQSHSITFIVKRGKV